METSEKYLGYSTYILGTTKKVIECLDIVLYNKSQFSNLKKISLYNLDEVLKSIYELDKYLHISREIYTDPFIYDKDNNRISGFDTIIYIDSLNNPVGYTEFINIQGIESDINISLDLNSKILGTIEVNLVNSLSHLRGGNILKNIGGTDLNNYVNLSELKKKLSSKNDSYSRYTNHLSSINKDKTSCIHLDTGIINNGELYRLYLNRDINIDIFGNDFSNNQIGYYKEDIVIYTWSDLNYSIYSITKKDKFGNPIIYTNKNSKGYDTVPELNPEVSEIQYFSGNTISIKTTNLNGDTVYKLFDIESSSWVSISDSERYLYDLWDSRSLIIKYPKIVNYPGIYNYFPSISNIYLDLKDYSRFNTINIISKIGDWYVLEQKKTLNEAAVIYTNMDKVIYFSIKELQNIIVINNKILMLKTDDPDVGKYYTYYIGPEKIYYSENYLKSIKGYDQELHNDLGIKLAKDETGKFVNESDYIERNITVDLFKNTSLPDSYLFGFRKNCLSGSFKIPDILGSLGGLLFYKEKNLLNYL